MAKRTPTPATGEPHYVLTESAEQQLWRARDLLRTLADLTLASAGPAHATLTLPAEALSTTLFMAVELLDLPMTYVPTCKEV